MPQKTLIVGDIQGCYRGLKSLLEKAQFNPKTDRLYAVGDLVARGEDSLSTLQYLRDLGDAFHCVLGNHDLHLLAVYCGLRNAKESDRLSPLLSAPDCETLIDWLRRFPLAMRLSARHTMVHAGLYPGWSTDDLLRYSDEVSTVLRGDKWADMLKDMYGNLPDTWQESLTGADRQRFIINACTRMRFVTDNNTLEFTNKNTPSKAPPELHPWFAVTNPFLSEKESVIFGHWAALEGQTNSAQFIGLDTGYVWGNMMTAYDLEQDKRISVSASS